MNFCKDCKWMHQHFPFQPVPICTRFVADINLVTGSKYYLPCSIQRASRDEWFEYLGANDETAITHCGPAATLFEPAITTPEITK